MCRRANPASIMGTNAAERIMALSVMAKQQMAKAPIFLYFTDVTEQDLARVAAADSKPEVKRLLAECMKIDEAEGFRYEILADMHYHNYTFCISRGFVPAKTSTLLSIMKRVLEESLSKRLEADKAFEEFKELLLRHGVERPPWSVGVFSFEDVQAIMQYVHNSFFRHYRLYTYAFMTRCDLKFSVDRRGYCVTQPALRPEVFIPADEVEACSQPEFAHLFKPSEAELAEAKLRELREAQAQVEEKSAKIKRKVDEGVARLMDGFKQKLKEQDDDFHAKLDAV